MKLISHRGNLNGSDPNNENNPNQIDIVINYEIDVEVDMWLIQEQWYLGHDGPQYLISYEWVQQRKNYLWIHCKNLNVLYRLITQPDNNTFNFFFHQNDDFTLTNNGYIWTLINKPITDKSIIVCLDKKIPTEYNKNNLFGICGDYVRMWKN